MPRHRTKLPAQLIIMLLDGLCMPKRCMSMLKHCAQKPRKPKRCAKSNEQKFNSSRVDSFPEKDVYLVRDRPDTLTFPWAHSGQQRTQQPQNLHQGKAGPPQRSQVMVAITALTLSSVETEGLLSMTWRMGVLSQRQHEAQYLQEMHRKEAGRPQRLQVMEATGFREVSTSIRNVPCFCQREAPPLAPRGNFIKRREAGHVR